MSTFLDDLFGLDGLTAVVIGATSGLLLVAPSSVMVVGHTLLVDGGRTVS